MHECETRFLSAIVDAGLQPPSEVIGDGKLHRFASSGRRGDDSGWYVLHLDGAVSAGVLGVSGFLCLRRGNESVTSLSLGPCQAAGGAPG
jgi:phage/plasmid primase-like uncharacterized protein